VKHEFASPGLHLTSATEQLAAEHGVAALNEVAKHADVDTSRGVPPASVRLKSSEPLLFEAHQSQRSGDLMRASEHGFASPGLHLTSATEQLAAEHGVAGLNEVAKHADVDAFRGLRPASVRLKLSEPLLFEAPQSQKSGDPIRASDESHASNAYDARASTARKKASEVLLTPAREPQFADDNTFAVTPSSHSTSRHQEKNSEARAVSSGKRPLSPARKQKTVKP
jgi:hypothetical protein